MNFPIIFLGVGGGLQQLCQQLLHPKQKQETFHTYQLSSPKHFIYQFSILRDNNLRILLGRGARAEETCLLYTYSIVVTLPQPVSSSLLLNVEPPAPCRAEIRTRDPCSGPLLRTLARDPCSGLLLRTLARDPCSGLLLGTLAQNPCSRSLLRTLAQDPCSRPLLRTYLAVGAVHLPSLSSHAHSIIS